MTGDSFGVIDKKLKKLGYKWGPTGELLTKRGTPFKSMRYLMRIYKREIGRGRQETMRFKFEWLGLMFAGMALTRVFGGYIDKVKQMTGITDLISTTFTLLLLPIFIKLLPFFIKVFKFINKLPAPIKTLLGILMILVTVVGHILYIISSFILAFISLAIVIGGLTGLVGLPLLTLTSEVIGAIILIGVAIAGLVAILVSTLSYYWDEISQFISGIKNLLIHAVKLARNIVLGILDIIIATIRSIIYMDFSYLRNAISRFVDSVKAELGGIYDSLLTILSAIEKIAEKSLGGAWDVIKSVVGGASKLIGLDEYLGYASKSEEGKGGTVINNNVEVVVNGSNIDGHDVGDGVTRALTAENQITEA